MRARRGLGSLLASGAVLAVAGCGGGADQGTPNTTPPSPFRPAAGSAPAGGTVSGPGTLTAFVARGTPLRAAPGGRALTTLPARTSFGSPQVVAVVDRRGGWLGVLASQLPNGRIGWISAGSARVYRTDWSIEARVSKRTLVVRQGSRIVARTPMAVGRPGHATPPGTYAVTDKLLINRPGSPYACCALALSGHQPKTPQGWGGGDRLAIHSTNDPSSIGQPVSLGCMRIGVNVARRLVRTVPLGTVVTVRA